MRSAGGAQRRSAKRDGVWGQVPDGVDAPGIVTVTAQHAVKVRSPNVLFGGVATILSSASPKLFSADFRLI